MNVRKSLIGQAALLAVTALYSIYMAPQLGPRVPTHWGISGKPDAWGSPTFGLWFGPGLVAAMMLLTWALPKMSPQKFEIAPFESTYGILMLAVGGLMSAMHFFILTASAGKPIDITKMMMVVIGLFFAFMGNFMGKVKRNFYMGVKTPWTLASERVWDATHRRAAVLWFFGGLFIAACALVGVPFAVSTIVLVVLSCLPVVDSYLLYRRYGKE